MLKAEFIDEINNINSSCCFLNPDLDIKPIVNLIKRNIMHIDVIRGWWCAYNLKYAHLWMTGKLEHKLKNKDVRMIYSRNIQKFMIGLDNNIFKKFMEVIR